MLMPKRVKRRKQFRGSMRGKALRGNKITYGEYGIVATEPAWITANQIEALKKDCTKRPFNSFNKTSKSTSLSIIKIKRPLRFLTKIYINITFKF